jgi:vacuolar-type H+-ATPase subunit I/STV1
MFMPEKPAVKKPKKTVGQILNTLIERVNNNMRRLRILEGDRNITKTRLNSLEEAMLTQRKEINKVLVEIKEEVFKQNDRIFKLENTLKEVISQLKKLATTTKIKELEDLIEIYNPIKSQFVTKEEIERIIEEKLKK